MRVRCILLFKDCQPVLRMYDVEGLVPAFIVVEDQDGMSIRLHYAGSRRHGLVYRECA